MIFFLKGTKKFLKAHLKEVETKTNRRLSKKRERTYMDNLTGKALAEYILRHPEDANSEWHWDTLCLADWVNIVRSHPELERFRPQLPAESPYTLLSIEEIIDLHRELQNDLKKSKILKNFSKTEKN